MPLSSTATGTVSALVPPSVSASASAAEKTVPSATSHRVYRCTRCADRKFRTTTDLALHILAKHGHNEQRVSVITKHASHNYDDARSITFMSPTLPISAATLTKRKKNKNMNSNNNNRSIITSSSCSSPALSSSSAIAHPSSFKIAKRPRAIAANSCTISKQQRPVQRLTHTTLSSHRKLVHPILPDYATPASTPAASAIHVKKFKQQHNLASRSPPRRTNCEEGESIGPVAQDVYVRKCLAGRIPIIPTDSQQPATTINFAQGLF